MSPPGGLDILFKNAGIADGTGKNIFKADVAVAGGRIEEVGSIPQEKADRVINAEGLVLSPGFVDIHGHSDYHILARPEADSKILQGVTTELAGNCGYSAAPVRGELAGERKEYCRDVLDTRIDFESLDEYIDHLQSLRPAINIAPLVGFNTLRASATGYKSDPPSKEEMKEIEAALAKALAQGAFGMSAGLAYVPACYSKKDELVACCRLVAKAGGIFTCHIRNEGRSLVEAVEEVIEIAEGAQAPLQVSHLKTSGKENWSKLDQVFEMIESAQKRGVRVRADRYPYLAAFTGLSSILPDWVFAGTKDDYLARIRDKAARKKIRDEVLALHPDPEYFNNVVIAEVFDPDAKRLEGANVADAAGESGKDPVDLVIELLDTGAEPPTAVYHTMSEDNLFRILKKDWVMIGSDSAVRAREGVLSKGKPHPRAFGTFPRLIAYAVREKRVLSLEHAIKKMTLDPCEAAGIKDRGIIQKGSFADLVLFDPEKVIDRAVYEEPHLFPEGIKMVVVNGKIAAEKGKLGPERNGKVLRRKT